MDEFRQNELQVTIKFIQYVKDEAPADKRLSEIPIMARADENTYFYESESSDMLFSITD